MRNGVESGKDCTAGPRRVSAKEWEWRKREVGGWVMDGLGLVLE